ncbi:MAG: peptidase inhibitor family I36 protein [Kibdelosporangium sp.]
MRRPTTLLLVVVAVLMSLLSTATAANSAPEPVAVQALSCPGGSLCAWPVTDGGSSRCSWSNADDDWWNAPVTCSWSSCRTVRALYNNGTSAAYAGVCVYRGANYTLFDLYLPQGASTTLAIGRLLRSHRWVRPGESC